MTNAPVNLQDLRRKIYVKAKAESSWRFWGLYVHVCKLETLHEAYELARANNGAPGTDGVTFAKIEGEAGVARFLQQIRDELVSRTYQPMRNRRKEIPKEGQVTDLVRQLRDQGPAWCHNPVPDWRRELLGRGLSVGSVNGYMHGVASLTGVARQNGPDRLERVSFPQFTVEVPLVGQPGGADGLAWFVLQMPARGIADFAIPQNPRHLGTPPRELCGCRLPGEAATRLRLATVPFA